MEEFHCAGIDLLTWIWKVSGNARRQEEKIVPKFEFHVLWYPRKILTPGGRFYTAPNMTFHMYIPSFHWQVNNLLKNVSDTQLKQEYKVSDQITDFKVTSTSGFLSSDEKFSATFN